MYQKYIKPFSDFFFSFLLLLLLSPVILIIAIIVYLINGTNPFFFQKRPGKDQRIFKLIKFKTMTDAKDEGGNLLPDDKRLTRLGVFMRKASLDELPQLINVVKGDMSFVGPRPLLVEYLGLYNDFQRKRHFAKPGITGWAQVNGRNNISWEKKFELDVWYVNHISLFLDCKICFLTFKKVILKEDINTDGVATTRKFTGK